MESKKHFHVHIMYVEKLLLSLLNIPLSSTLVFLQFTVTRCLRDHQSKTFRVLFQPHFLLKDNGSPLSFQFLIMCCTVLNPILSFCNLFRCFLSLMHSNDLTLLKLTNIFSTNTGCLSISCLRHKKLLIASTRVK